MTGERKVRLLQKEKKYSWGLHGVVTRAQGRWGNVAIRGTFHVGSNPKQDSHLRRKQNTTAGARMYPGGRLGAEVGGCRQGLCGFQGATVLPGVMCLYNCLVGLTAVVPQGKKRQGTAPHTRRWSQWAISPNRENSSARNSKREYRGRGVVGVRKHQGGQGRTTT